MFFHVFEAAPMVVYSLMSVLSMSQHRCLCRCLCKLSPFEKITQNLVKNIIDNVAIYVTLLGSFFDWPGGLGANQNASGKLGMKLAIWYM